LRRVPPTTAALTDKRWTNHNLDEMCCAGQRSRDID
jgi:hypothetical protein